MLRYMPLMLLAGCYAVGNRARELERPLPMYYASVRIDSAVGVTLVPSTFAVSGNGGVGRVLELGGRVLSMTEDSIVINPSYLIVADTLARAGRRVLRLGAQGFPMNAVVRPEPGVTIGPYRRPRSQQEVILTRLFWGARLAMWASIYYGFFTHPW